MKGWCDIVDAAVLDGVARWHRTLTAVGADVEPEGIERQSLLGLDFKEMLFFCPRAVGIVVYWANQNGIKGETMQTQSEIKGETGERCFG